jgi:hypothetical protein
MKISNEWTTRETRCMVERLNEGRYTIGSSIRVNTYTWYVNKAVRLPAYRTNWQHCGLTLQVKGR